jgi:hypothetical protein
MPPAITFTKPVSKMKKVDLQRLCQHFQIPAEGNVETLRNRLKTYLRHHEDDLKENEAYAALYPPKRGRQPRAGVNPIVPAANDNPSRSPSQQPSNHSGFSAWNGVEGPIVAELNIQENFPNIHQPPPSPAPSQRHESPPIIHRTPSIRSRTLGKYLPSYNPH